MEWGAEQIALAVAGALFLVGLVASLHPRLVLSLATRIVLSAAAGAYVAAAITLSRFDSPMYGPLVWFASIAAAVVVTRDALGYRVHVLRWRGISASQDLPHQIAQDDVDLGDDSRARIDRAMDPAASSAELEELAYTLPEARRAVAAHASTPASVLSWLASQGDDAVAAAIAERPAAVRHDDHRV